MIILSLDQATTTGATVVKYDGFSRELIKHECVKFKKKDKLKQVFLFLVHAVKKYKPDVVITEEVYLGKNVKTYGALSELKGVITAACGVLHVPNVVYSPNTVRSWFSLKDKHDVYDFCVEFFPELEGAKLDVTDSLLMALYHIETNRKRV